MVKIENTKPHMHTHLFKDLHLESMTFKIKSWTYTWKTRFYLFIFDYLVLLHLILKLDFNKTKFLNLSYKYFFAYNILELV